MVYGVHAAEEGLCRASKRPPIRDQGHIFHAHQAQVAPAGTGVGCFALSPHFGSVASEKGKSRAADMEFAGKRGSRLFPKSMHQPKCIEPEILDWPLHNKTPRVWI